MKSKIALFALSATLLIGTIPLTANAQVPDNVDTSVIDEEEEVKPLTPDGNMTLVDDIAASSDGHKQFMTVTTKSGHIFYIIVDRDDNGTNTVHFLNQVDERDLMDLMSDEDKEEIEESTGAKVETPVQESTDADSETTEDTSTKKKTSAPNPILGLCIVLGLGGVAAFYFISNSDSFKRKKKGVDPDSDYADDYIDIPTEDGKEDE